MVFVWFVFHLENINCTVFGWSIGWALCMLKSAVCFVGLCECMLHWIPLLVHALVCLLSACVCARTNNIQIWSVFRSVLPYLTGDMLITRDQMIVSYACRVSYIACIQQTQQPKKSRSQLTNCLLRSIFGLKTSLHHQIIAIIECRCCCCYCYKLSLKNFCY